MINSVVADIIGPSNESAPHARDVDAENEVVRIRPPTSHRVAPFVSCEEFNSCFAVTVVEKPSHFVALRMQH